MGGTSNPSETDQSTWRHDALPEEYRNNGLLVNAPMREAMQQLFAAPTNGASPLSEEQREAVTRFTAMLQEMFAPRPTEHDGRHSALVGTPLDNAELGAAAEQLLAGPKGRLVESPLTAEQQEKLDGFTALIQEVLNRKETGRHTQLPQEYQNGGLAAPEKLDLAALAAATPVGSGLVSDEEARRPGKAEQYAAHTYQVPGYGGGMVTVGGEFEMPAQKTEEQQLREFQQTLMEQVHGKRHHAALSHLDPEKVRMLEEIMKEMGFERPEGIKGGVETTSKKRKEVPNVLPSGPETALG